MKKIALLFIAGITLALVFTGCDDKEYVDAATGFTLSQNSVVLGTGEGVKMIYVQTNDPGFTARSSEDWITARVVALDDLGEGDDSGDDGDDQTRASLVDYREQAVRLEYSANGTAGVRTAVVTVTSADGLYERTVHIRQASVNVQDLTVEGTANCYVVPVSGEFRFRADVRGNGGSDGASGYLEEYGVDIIGGVYADLLWEAVTDADRTQSSRVIDGDPVYENGYIYFSSGNIAGNAVIAIKDQGDNVLWSWHIWVNTTMPTTVENNGYTWLDRNLGAVGNNPSEIMNRGMHYQWGRKDPILPSYADYIYVASSHVTSANLDNVQVGNGSAVWDYNRIEGGSFYEEAPGELPRAVSMPTTFLKGAQDTYDWYLSQESEAQAGSGLWQANSKTIFDPCPLGYRVPAGQAFTTNGWEAAAGFGRMRSASDFFPMAGCRNGSDGQLMYCSGRGIYWTASVANSESAAFVLTEDDIYLDNLNRSTAASIRCVAE